MTERYRVNSFVPPVSTGLDRIYFVERKTLLGWREVEEVRGTTPEAAMASLRRQTAEFEPIEFSLEPTP
jgi:hypothetical protein